MAERNLEFSLYEVIFQWRLSSIEGCLPSKVVFHRRLSSIKGHLPSKVVFQQRSSSIEGRLPSKVVPSKVVFPIPWLYLMCSGPFRYQWILSQPPLKLTVTGGQTGGQKEKATYRGSSYRSAQKKGKEDRKHLVISDNVTSWAAHRS